MCMPDNSGVQAKESRLKTINQVCKACAQCVRWQAGDATFLLDRGDPNMLVETRITPKSFFQGWVWNTCWKEALMYFSLLLHHTYSPFMSGVIFGIRQNSHVVYGGIKAPMWFYTTFSCTENEVVTRSCRLVRRSCSRLVIRSLLLKHMP